jgi:hypothetical protein
MFPYLMAAPLSSDIPPVLEQARANLSVFGRHDRRITRGDRFVKPDLSVE